MQDKDTSIVKEARNANRSAMPTVAGFIDELRLLGLSPKVIYASENGITVGKCPSYAEVFDIQRGYRMETGNAKRK